MIDYQSLLSLLYEIIEEISDPIFQERIWVKGEGPECSSFDEAICGFFDDSQAAYILENSNKFLLSENQTKALKDLYFALSEYSDKTPNNLPDAEIVSDPKWHQIQVLAKKTMTIFQDHPFLKTRDKS